MFEQDLGIVKFYLTHIRAEGGMPRPLQTIAFVRNYFFPTSIAACAAARRAIGTLNGEQET